MPKKSAKTIPYNELAVKKIATTKHDLQTAYTIQGVPGLMLTCFPSGSATYSVRVSVGGQRRKEGIGQFDVISLADARARALEVAAGAAKGVDVLGSKIARERDAMTLKQLWDLRAEKETERVDTVMKQYQRLLEVEIFPRLGNRPATKITADDIADILVSVEDRMPDKARRTKVALSSLFKWGQKRRLVKVNPIAGLGFNYRGKPRKRVLTDAEMARLWSGISTCPNVTEPMRNIIRLAILTGQRNSEVAGMECSELKGLDGSTPRWDIPAMRMKRKSDDQHVPLSRQAAEILRSALATSSNGLHVFQGVPVGRRAQKWRQGHIGQESVSRGMAKVAVHSGLVDVHLHDMRKCITSWLAEHGHATPEVLDAILHHGRQGVTGSHYNFALYERQVRHALQVWADHIWRIGEQAQNIETGGQVVHLRA